MLPQLSPEINLSAADASIVQALGAKVILEHLSREYGFVKGYVQKIWEHAGDFQNTELILIEMRKAAEEVATAYIESLGHSYHPSL
jgi:hypothetical protein